MHRGGEQQRRDRREVAPGVTVREHDEARALGDGLGDLGEDLLEAGLHRRGPAGDVVEPAHHVGGVAGQVAVGVDVDDLGEGVVVDDREGQHDLASVGRVGVECVSLGADRRAERGDELLADGVERRVGHLREELGEVVEDQPRARRQHGDRGVGAHRPEGLTTGLRHRGEQHAQLLLGVAEGLLATGHRGRGVHDVLALGQVVEVHEARVQPLLVRVLRGQACLHLVVRHDATVLGVDQEHPARLQAALLDDPRRVELEDAGLRGQHHQAVVGDGVPGRAQAVAVEHGSDERAVGEGDGGGAVPGLHEGRVELVERPARGVHLLVVLPGLRDHHEHGVRQRPATEVQQLEHLVEGGRVRRVRGADREQALEVAGDQVRGQLALPGPHPVAVALDGVDLAVVGDHPVGVCERPGRERVGREARVHQRQLGGEAAVRQVGEERLELAGGQHALVDQGPRRQRREVDLGLALGALAQAVGQAVEADTDEPTGRGGDEQLPEGRHAVARDLAHDLGVGGHVAPAEDAQVLLRGNGLDRGGGLGAPGLVGRQEGDAHGIRAGDGEVEVDDVAEEGVRDLRQDAGPVTDERVGAGGTAVLEVAQGGQGVVDDVVSSAAAHRGHHGHAAGVVLELAAVQPRVGGLGGEARRGHSGHRPWGYRCGCAHQGWTRDGHRKRAWTALATACGDDSPGVRIRPSM